MLDIPRAARGRRFHGENGRFHDGTPTIAGGEPVRFSHETPFAAMEHGMTATWRMPGTGDLRHAICGRTRSEDLIRCRCAHVRVDGRLLRSSS